jgi:hypothetical protein
MNNSKKKFAEIEKYVNYLKKYQSNLESSYTWNAKIDGLVELETLTKDQITALNQLSPFEKEINLKKIVGQKLNDSFNSNKDLFDKLCLWIIKDWGGIKAKNDEETLKLIYKFLISEKPDFKRIASTSKVGAYMFPDKNVIYDSRVAYALNWIILSENIENRYFPIPAGRNSKMLAFDMNVLIRLKNISIFQVKDINQLDDKRYINRLDNKLFISEREAYKELISLLSQINHELWKGDPERENNLYYTEMLLFAIADKEIFIEITNNFSVKKSIEF